MNARFKSAARGAWALSIMTALSLVLGTSTALADPLDDKERKNKSEISETKSQIDQINAQLAADQAAVDQSQIQAQLAGQAYIAALDSLQQVKEAQKVAEKRAAVADEKKESTRKGLARFVVAYIQSQGGISKAKVFLDQNGIDEVIDRATVFNILGDQAQQAIDRYRSASDDAKTFEMSAKAAIRETQKATDEAAQAKAASDQAAAAADAQLVTTKKNKASAAKRLASLENTSVQIAAEKIERAQAKARADAEAKAREEAEARARAQSRNNSSGSSSPAPSSDSPSSGSSSGGSSSGSSSGGSSGGSGTPAVPFTPGQARSTAAQGLAALKWARAQIGKPYIWGGVGPTGFDCSGLTQQAWRNGGGIAIQRTASQQAATLARIPLSQMRPGDLIYYTTNPSTPWQTYHVTMYAGGGKMVAAPAPGRLLQEQPVYYTNIMPYVGRP